MLKKFLFLVLLSTLSFSETESLEQFQKQVAESAKSSGQAGEDLEAADLVLGTFLMESNGKPFWYFSPYPTPQEMAPGSSKKPRIILLKSDTSKATPLAPLFEVYRKKGKSCNAAESIILDPPHLSYLNAGALSNSEYCLEGARGFSLAASRLASLETSPAEGAEQQAFVSMLNKDALSETQKNQLMNNPGMTLTELLAGINSDSEKQKLLEPKKIIFKKFVPHPDHPQALGYITAQVGTLLLNVPVPLPPQPKCQVQVVSSQPILGKQLGVGGAADYVDVKFKVLADSVIVGGSLSLGNGKQVDLKTLDILPFQAAQFGEFNPTTVKDAVLRITKADLDDARINRANAVYINGNRAQQFWKVEGQVFGVDSGKAASSCSVGLLIDYPLEPACSMTVSKSQILKGESTVGTLNCASGGPVTAVRIDTVVNGAVVATKNLPVPQPDPLQTYTFTHVRYSPASGEEIRAVVSGLPVPGQTTPTAVVTVPLGNVCPYNDTTFERKEYSLNELFRCDAQECGYAKGDLIFTMGYKNYSPKTGVFLRSEAATKHPGKLGIDACVDDTGDWNGCYRDEAIEECNGDNLCMMIGDMDNANYNSYRPGGHLYWVEVGKADLSNGGKYDPRCRVQKTRLRFGGCFAPNTRLQMADGQEKLVSEIMEDDYVFNPHYQTGVRVRKVVKGPEQKSLYEVQLGKNSIQVTEDHPFLTQRGWVQALALKKGDQLMGEGPGKQVTRVEKLKYLGPQDVWNFELDTEDPLAHVVVANGIPTGDLVTQQELKKGKKPLP
ncbi:hypothetical protein EBR78_08510 [bacterium]|nr:hypothetical protein [bacterium]